MAVVSTRGIVSASSFSSGVVALAASRGRIARPEQPE